MRMFFRSIFFLPFFIVFPVVVYATHSWGGYHWARTANPFTLRLGDNVSSVWDGYLTQASSDWSNSDPNYAHVLNTTVVPGLAGKNCQPTGGRVEVCNRKYGNNGWLGIAQIWVSGTHILQGVTKMNDTYFNTGTYNTPAWRQMVMCQEIGHTLGLDHQDTTFNNTNLGTCMDYTSNPLGPPDNEHPNAHDYEELAIIYQHLDSITTVGQTTTKNGKGMPDWVRQGTFDNASDWGKELRNNGKVALFERDFGSGSKLLTFVILAN